MKMPKKKVLRKVMLRGSKGLGQIDWPISLGFFLIYLIWFFVIISPLAKTPQEAPMPLMDIIEEKFSINSQWELSAAPVIAIGNLSGESEPLIAGAPSDYLRDNVYLEGEYFVIDEGKIMLLGNTLQKKFFWLLRTNKDYELPSATADLEGDETYSSVHSKNFQADFASGLLADVKYKSRDRINGFNIFIGGAPLSTAINNFTSSPIVNSYKVQGAAENRHYIFGDNSRVYSFIKTPSPLHVELNFSLANYTNYYASSGDYGVIDYGGSGCSSRRGNFINFYDAHDSITFTAGRELNIIICNTPTSLALSFAEIVEGEMEYYAMLHEGDNDEGILFLGAGARLGVIENIRGLSREKLDLLSMQNYHNLKNEWAFPKEGNFKIIVYNSTSILDNSTKIFEIGSDPFEFAEVHAKTIKTDLIDQYNNRIRSTINLRVWI